MTGSDQHLGVTQSSLSIKELDHDITELQEFKPNSYLSISLQTENIYVHGGLQIQPRFYFHPVDVVLWLVFLSLLARRAPSAVSATCV